MTTDRHTDKSLTIYGIGRNYEAHARELGNAVPKGEPVVFLKAASSLRGLNGARTAYPEEELHFEAELVLRVGKTIPFGTTNPGWDAIDAVALGLDLTRRAKQTDLKNKGLPWTLAKSFHGASIVTPFIKTSEIDTARDIEFHFYLNGTLRQSGNTRDMIFDVPYILNFLAIGHTLVPGDLIFTGTPEGVGPMRKGDRFTLELARPQYKWDGTL